MIIYLGLYILHQFCLSSSILLVSIRYFLVTFSSWLSYLSEFFFQNGVVSETCFLPHFIPQKSENSSLSPKSLVCGLPSLLVNPESQSVKDKEKAESKTRKNETGKKKEEEETGKTIEESMRQNCKERRKIHSPFPISSITVKDQYSQFILQSELLIHSRSLLPLHSVFFVFTLSSFSFSFSYFFLTSKLLPGLLLPR